MKLHMMMLQSIKSDFFYSCGLKGIQCMILPQGPKHPCSRIGSPQPCGKINCRFVRDWFQEGDDWGERKTMSSSSFEMELMWILIPSPIFSITLTMNHLPKTRLQLQTWPSCRCRTWCSSWGCCFPPRPPWQGHCGNPSWATMSQHRLRYPQFVHQKYPRWTMLGTLWSALHWVGEGSGRRRSLQWNQRLAISPKFPSSLKTSNLPRGRGPLKQSLKRVGLRCAPAFQRQSWIRPSLCARCKPGRICLA